MAKDSKTGGPTVALLMAYPQKTGWAALVDKGSFLFPTYRSLLLPDPLLLLALLSLLKSPPCSQRCSFSSWTAFEKPAEVLKSQERHFLSTLIKKYL